MEDIMRERGQLFNNIKNNQIIIIIIRIIIITIVLMIVEINKWKLLEDL